MYLTGSVTYDHTIFYQGIVVGTHKGTLETPNISFFEILYLIVQKCNKEVDFLPKIKKLFYMIIY